MFSAIAKLVNRKSKKRESMSGCSKMDKDAENCMILHGYATIQELPKRPSGCCKKRGEKKPLPTPRLKGNGGSLSRDNSTKSGQSSCSFVASECDSWRIKLNRCKDHEILQLYLTGQLTDCSFIVGKDEDEKVTFKCHRIILASASSKFEQLFFCGDGDKNGAPPNAISIETSPTAFDLVMKYIYGNKVLFPNPEISIEMCKLAYAWCLPHLVHAAENYLVSNAGVDHYLLAFEMYNEQGRMSEKLRFLNMIRMNAAAVLKTKQWLFSTPTTVREVLGFCRHLLFVQNKFNALLAWGKSQVELENKDVGVTDFNKQVREKIGPFLSLVDLDMLSPREFASRYSQEAVLSAKERLDILVRIVMK